MQYPIGYKSMIIMFQMMMIKKNQNQFIIKNAKKSETIKIIYYITIFWNYILINICLNKEK